LDGRGGKPPYPFAFEAILKTNTGGAFLMAKAHEMVVRRVLKVQMDSEMIGKMIESRLDSENRDSSLWVKDRILEYYERTTK
jgi:hypothetical protein